MKTALTNLMGLIFGVWLFYPFISSFFNPDPGYIKDPDSFLPFKHVWSPGARHPKHVHISAAEKEKVWVADPGYYFPNKGDLVAVWQANRGHPVSDQIRSDSVEGQWVADPGYRFADTRSNRSHVPSAAAWAPNTAHPNCPQLIAADRPSTWRAAPGYRLVSSDSFDVTKIQAAPTVASSLSGGEIALGVLVAFVTNALARPADDDGAIATAGRFVAKEIRDQTAKAVIGSFARETPKSPEILSCNYWGGIPVK